MNNIVQLGSGLGLGLGLGLGGMSHQPKATQARRLRSSSCRLGKRTQRHRATAQPSREGIGNIWHHSGYPHGAHEGDAPGSSISLGTCQLTAQPMLQLQSSGRTAS